MFADGPKPVPLQSSDLIRGSLVCCPLRVLGKEIDWRVTHAGTARCGVDRQTRIENASLRRRRITGGRIGHRDQVHIVIRSGSVAGACADVEGEVVRAEDTAKRRCVGARTVAERDVL